MKKNPPKHNTKKKKKTNKKQTTPPPKKKPQKKRPLKCCFHPSSYLAPTSKTILDQSLGREPCFIQPGLSFFTDPLKQGNMLCGPGHQNVPQHSNLSNSWREPDWGVSHVPESCLLNSLLTEVVTPKISPLLELLPPSQEDGQVWQQVGQTAQAMHVTNSTSQPLYLFCSNSSSLEATLEGFQFSLSYFHCPAVSSTLFASYSH